MTTREELEHALSEVKNDIELPLLLLQLAVKLRIARMIEINPALPSEYCDESLATLHALLDETFTLYTNLYRKD